MALFRRWVCWYYRRRYRTLSRPVRQGDGRVGAEEAVGDRCRVRGDDLQGRPWVAFIDQGGLRDGGERPLSRLLSLRQTELEGCHLPFAVGQVQKHGYWLGMTGRMAGDGAHGLGVGLDEAGTEREFLQSQRGDREGVAVARARDAEGAQVLGMPQAAFRGEHPSQEDQRGVEEALLGEYEQARLLACQTRQLSQLAAGNGGGRGRHDMLVT